MPYVLFRARPRLPIEPERALVGPRGGAAEEREGGGVREEAVLGRRREARGVRVVVDARAVVAPVRRRRDGRDADSGRHRARVASPELVGEVAVLDARWPRLPEALEGRLDVEAVALGEVRREDEAGAVLRAGGRGRGGLA